jgi:hypothetical protein
VMSACARRVQMAKSQLRRPEIGAFKSVEQCVIAIGGNPFAPIFHRQRINLGLLGGRGAPLGLLPGSLQETLFESDCGSHRVQGSQVSLTTSGPANETKAHAHVGTSK